MYQAPIVFAIAVIASCFYTAKLYADDNVLKANFWATGFSSSRASYESVLSKLILEKTQKEFGPYQYSINYLDVNYERGRRIAAEGNEVNFFTNPLPARKMIIDRELNVIPVPVMKGLLGYRVLIVRAEDLEKFAAIKSFSELQNFKAGQINHWADTSVYKENSLPLVTSTTLDSLFFMLSRRRFDYIPLGISEARQTLDEYANHYKGLAIVPDVMIYYPFPVFYQVSKHHQALASRLEIGLNNAVTDGTLDNLFNSYFYHVLEKLKSDKLRIFSLKNRQLPANYGSTQPDLVTAGVVVQSPTMLSAR